MFIKAILLVIVPFGMPALYDTKRAEPLLDAPAKPPVVGQAAAAADVIVVIAADGSLKMGGVAVEPAAVQEAAKTAISKDQRARLRLVADERAPLIAIKKVTKAAGAGGMNSVTFQSLKKQP